MSRFEAPSGTEELLEDSEQRREEVCRLTDSEEHAEISVFKIGDVIKLSNLLIHERNRNVDEKV